LEHCFLKSPVGWLKLEADETGVAKISFLDDAPTQSPQVINPHLKQAYRQLTEYFKGDRSSFQLTLNPEGTEFQRRVWQRLEGVPFGQTITYKELADTIGKSQAQRAIGQANNKNPIPIVIPCHRVIGKSGDLVGYAGGIDRKKLLLELEGIDPA
jgi:methylated-DNA-[protein]-cysteine S-methyltransferase